MTLSRDGGPEPTPAGPDADGSASGNADSNAASDVGSVGEEAAKLLGALGGWARDSADAGPDAGQGAGDGAGHRAGPRAGQGGLGGFAGHAAQAMSGIDEHLATAAAECTYCPICRTVHAVRNTSPEVREHLASAASSLLLALNGLVAARPHRGPDSPPDEQFERIDLDGDDD
ncbi:hypothetical protein [Nocardioides sp. 1609]|uniref:hypothetical protein n=1 Tax=Nocardioides sp. 1609 TaxID=2508327 RepID=UPI00106FD3A9|nr:hypothetical protein [Nocardioides sp. 1609]